MKPAPQISARPPEAAATARPLSLSERRPRLAGALFVAVCATGFAIMFAGFFAFTVDDGFIVSRYARNLVTRGVLAYNPGEPISALTSPLHALLVALAYRWFGETILFNKLFGLAALAAALLLAVRPFRRQPLPAATVVALAALSPFAVLWVGAGLETGLLLLIVTAAAAVLYDRPPADTISAGRGLVLSSLAGLAFLARLDAPLFLLPAALYCARRMPLRRAFACALPALALSLAWLGFSQAYFGDVLPTSFYVKTPRLDPRWAAGNLLYMADFYLVSGFLACQVLLLAILALEPRARSAALRPHFSELWWAYVGLGMVVLYGVATARTHMMFSYRLLVPFLPTAALLTADLVSRVARAASGRQGIGQVLRAAVAVVLALQAVSFLQVRSYGIAGGRSGEFRSTSAADANEVVQVLGRPADLIRDHWRRQPASRQRRARIQTGVGGALPYRLPEADAYDALAAYRHRCRPSVDALRKQVDYFAFYSPSYVSRAEDVSALRERYELIFEESMVLDGVERKWLVFFNPDPEPFVLPPRIDDPCLAPGHGEAS